MKSPTEVTLLLLTMADGARSRGHRKSLRRSQMLAAQAEREFIRSPFFRAPAIG